MWMSSITGEWGKAAGSALKLAQGKLRWGSACLSGADGKEAVWQRQSEDGLSF